MIDGKDHVTPYLYARWATHDLHVKDSGIMMPLLQVKQDF